MNPVVAAADLSFAEALATSQRGPERDGTFALWLVVRAALATGAGHPPRHAERLRAVAARLRSLAVAAPLRRALTSALAELGPRGAGPAVALSQLAAPAQECLGARLAAVVAEAARDRRAAAA